MYPKFKLVRNLAKLIFCLRNTQSFLQKMSTLSQNQIQKDDVEWLTRMSNNQQDGAKYEGSLLSTTPQSPSVSSVTSQYLFHSQIHCLIPQNSKQWLESEARLSKSADVTWRHQPFFGRLIRSQSQGKKHFLNGQTSRNCLKDTFVKFRIVN